MISVLIKIIQKSVLNENVYELFIYAGNMYREDTACINFI